MTIGELGEQLIAQWLEAQSWLILAHRWRCCWGEIDLVAHKNTLAFIEVKTRSSRNWDANGLFALTAQKQLKLQRTAALFLAHHSHLAHLPCRFDVALLGYRQPPSSKQPDDLPHFMNSGSMTWQGYQWTLHQYIESAFDTV